MQWPVAPSAATKPQMLPELHTDCSTVLMVPAGHLMLMISHSHKPKAYVASRSLEDWSLGQPAKQGTGAGRERSS